MNLTLADIQNANTDEDLFQRLSSTLTEVFPPELQDNRDQFYAALLAAPRGLRAMAGTYDLDVCMSLDDLAWHFGNHNDERFLEETATGLRELEAEVRRVGMDRAQTALGSSPPVLKITRRVLTAYDRPASAARAALLAASLVSSARDVLRTNPLCIRSL